jgi:hypothetical protein
MNAHCTLEFSVTGRYWIINGEGWTSAPTFLTHDAAMDYITRNGLVYVQV